ncbi:hypothetical protein JKP88DRAFT_265795 [Tribonema minus]|uniref:Uncharacterized protein n=1 Tax=Tribonema minus TaxID=303371 RepID=A0A836C8L4_9STRA|nr:hypothetical protein JKP88DRAFT_265795 [Tribonema minus]
MQMLHRAGSEFGPLSDVQSSDLDEMLSVVRQALMDVRCTLLELSEQDIEELSQASLIVARIALSYAKAAHGQLAHAMHVEVPPPPPPQQQSRKASGKEGGARNGSASPTASQQQAEDEEEASHAADGSYQRQALWQPLAPQLWQQAQGLAEQGKKKPATALALLTAALPFAWMPVVFGAPLLVTDAVVQWGVGTPLGQRADQAAAEALQVAHLWLLLAKVGARQSFRLAKLEFERMGGLPGLADAGVKAVADPVHTAKSLWGWSQMAVGGVKQQVDWFRGMAGMLGNKPQA